MKISIGAKTIEGPFGGGNEFLKNLKKQLKVIGYTVTNNLKDNDIDIILLTNPLPDSETSTFNNFDIDYYIKFKNPNAVVFHRINECDERKGTKNINSKIDFANKSVDINIFVSEWLKDIYKNFNLSKKPNVVIKGGPSKEIFNMYNKQFWNKDEKIKLVTHHWSSNKMKGFDIYKQIDKLINSSNLDQKIEFTYIGNLPSETDLNNSTVIKPIHGEDLAAELKKHHVYVTASLNEPSGNHHMEGALCGLPVMYINSGALPEYCSKYGVSFDIGTFNASLNNIANNYSLYFDSLKEYPYTAEHAVKQFDAVFKNSLKELEEIKLSRSIDSKKTVLFNYVVNKVRIFLYSRIRLTKNTLGKLKKIILFRKNDKR